MCKSEMPLKFHHKELGKFKGKKSGENSPKLRNITEIDPNGETLKRCRQRREITELFFHRGEIHKRRAK